MSLPLFTIRPEPGLAATLAAVRAAGLDIRGTPLFEIRARAWEPPSPRSLDGILLGSANALRHAGAGLGAFRDLPVYAVGEATAKAAREHGLVVAQVGSGRLQGVVDGLAGRELRLLRLTGVEHVPLRLPAGITVETRIVYDSVPIPMPAGFAAQLRAGGVVLLHSAVAARHFASECDRLEVPRAGLAIAAMAPRIRDAVGPGWREARTASALSEDALLALAQDMCH